MPILPSLSRTERERISAAAKLHVEGVPMKWRRIFPCLAYVVAGKEHVVFTQQTRRVFNVMCDKATEFFNAETQRLVEAREAAEKEAARTAQAGTDRHPSARVEEREIPAVSAA
jgi:hypothetical protein